MGDEVSAAEWKRRREGLDKRLSSEENLLRSPSKGWSSGKEKAYNDWKMDQASKKAYSKELGYDQPKAAGTKKKAPARKR